MINCIKPSVRIPTRAASARE